MMHRAIIFIQLNIMKNLNDIMKHCVLKKKEQEGDHGDQKRSIEDQPGINRGS